MAGWKDSDAIKMELNEMHLRATRNIGTAVFRAAARPPHRTVTIDLNREEAVSIGYVDMKI